MQPMTLREVVEEWWAYKGTGPVTPQVMAELVKVEAATALVEWFAGPMSPSIEMRQSRQLGCRLACRYWDAKQAAAKFQSNQ